MREVVKQNQRWVACHFGHKVKELHYYLTAIVVACDDSLRLFADGQTIQTGNSDTVIYGFSSFANVIQTLKDTAKTITGQQLPWSMIAQLRHGAFMRDARNAATHDGNPIVSAWADGRYFVPMNILRLDRVGNLIEIPAPRQDIRTVCVEFAADFSNLLREALRDRVAIAELRGTSFSMIELDEAVTNSFVLPDFVKHLFGENRAEIASLLANIKHDPVAQALGFLSDLIGYCDSMRLR